MSDSIKADSSPAETPPHYQLHCPQLPLAVYREVAAHVRQVTGVDAGLLPSQAKTFDYLQSQVGGLWIRYSDAADPLAHRRVEQILAYYGDRFGPWESLKP